jgi:hypothetical protein
MSVALTVEAYMYTTAHGVLLERHLTKPEPDYLCMSHAEAVHAIRHNAPALVAAGDRAAVRGWWLRIGGEVREVEA